MRFLFREEISFKTTYFCFCCGGGGGGGGACGAGGAIYPPSLMILRSPCGAWLFKFLSLFAINITSRQRDYSNYIKKIEALTEM